MKHAALAIMVVMTACADSGPDTNSKVTHATTPAVHNQWIVQTTPGAAVPLLGMPVLHRYTAAFHGVAVQGSQRQVEEIAKHPDVIEVFEDQMVYTEGTQLAPPPGLDRIDQRALPLDDSYTWLTDGTGVNVYVLDTGLHFSHEEFAGRTAPGANFVQAGTGGPCDWDATDDCNGHGTHVAGIAAGTTYGVAKGATVHPIRVLGCCGSGATSGVIAGLDHVAANGIKPAVANMSLRSGPNPALDAAVQAVIDGGIPVVVSAGNSNGDACDWSPSGVLDAIVVGATYYTDDAIALFTNHGSCVDLYAPGVGILSAWWGNNTDTRTLNGTSMAAPFVTGAVALYLEAHPDATPAEAWTAIEAEVSHIIADPFPGSPDGLLYTGELCAP